jgi:hypothetical protein
MKKLRFIFEMSKKNELNKKQTAVKDSSIPSSLDIRVIDSFEKMKKIDYVSKVIIKEEITLNFRDIISLRYNDNMVFFLDIVE